MCGITGALGLPPLEPDRISALIDTLKHRGPDHTGVLQEGPVALAMARLSIIDLSSAGNQPLHSADGKISLVFNGEIYNYRTLRKEIEAHIPFRTASDTEVILNGYALWGEDVFRRLNGIFAVALWDRDRQALVLARDPLGAKPLYLLETPTHLFFSSEIKTFTQTRLANAGDRTALFQFLSAGYVFHPHTAIRGVSQLLPGQILTAHASGERTRRTFRLPGVGQGDRIAPPPDPATAKKTLADGLMQAIVGQTVADVPFGLLLSSGLDSLALVAALRKAGLTDNLRTYTVGFTEEGFAEQHHVRRLADRLGFRNTLVPFEAKRVEELWDAACLTYDNLELLPTALAIQEASRVASADVRLLLAGNGGDEIFLGYPTYVATDLVRRYGARLALFVPLLRRGLSLLPASDGYLGGVEKLERFATGFDREADLAHARWRHVFSPAALSSLLTPEAREELPPSALLYDPQLLHARDAARHGWSGTDVDSWADLRSWLVDCGLMMWDKAGMASGVEIRVPLVDPDFVDTAFSIPASLRAGGKVGSKRLLRDILAPHLPADILSLPKHGFQLPVASWLRGPLRPLFRSLTADLPSTFFRPAEIERLWHAFENRRGNHALQLWALGALAGWMRAHHVRWI